MVRGFYLMLLRVALLWHSPKWKPQLDAPAVKALIHSMPMRATYFFTNDQPHDIDIHSANHLFAKHFPSEANNPFVNLIFLLAHHMS